jgi:hypothetical protein
MPSSGMLHCVALVFLRSVHRLLVTDNVVPSSLILLTLMMEALSSSETSVLTSATRRNIPEDAILQGYFCPNLPISLEGVCFSPRPLPFLHRAVSFHVRFEGFTAVYMNNSVC